MAKIRVHELAKEFGIPSKEMAAKIKDLGYPIKNYMSTLDETQAQQIRLKLKGQQQEQPEERPSKPKAIVRRKHRVVHIKKIIRRPATTQEAEPQPVPAEEDMAKKGEVQGPAEVKEAKSVQPTTEESVETTPEKAPAVETETESPETAKESPLPKPAKGEEGEPQKVLVEPEVKPETEDQALASHEEKTTKEGASEGEAQEKPSEVKKEGHTPRPKQFVKILDRPRIELPQRTAKKTPSVKTKKHAKRPVGEIPSAPPITDASKFIGAPEHKGKKKGKRVVQMADLGAYGKKRKGLAKRKGKGHAKSINQILAEERRQFRHGKKTAKATHGAPPAEKQEQPTGTAPIKAEKRRFAIYETIQPVELAKKMGIKVGDVIMKLMNLGVMVTANQSIDFDTAAIIASEFGYSIEKKAVAEDLVHVEEVEGGEPAPRPPVVTVMGHVDHGKTSLLDAIRKADVVSKEAGGITQHIGAYDVRLPSGEEVVFLDTPGHEAFTSMRARGAEVTDIVILVVAADDGVMAQTKEAIDHARAAKVPLIVAINKIDKPGAEPERVKRELAEYGLVPEEWGGDTIFVNVSAKKGIGIEELLEMMTLQAEILELKAVPEHPARGHVIESRLDKGRGPVATLLIEDGTLHVGDALVVGIYYGKVRAMINDRGQQLKSAGPSMPVEVQGLSGVPEAGNEFTVLPDEKKAREVAEYRQRKAREAELVKSNKVSLESVFEKLKEKELRVLNILLKADVQGSLEALSDALVKLSTDKIKIDIVRGSIGAITESDVLLASASNAVIIGFNVKPSPKAKSLAEQEHVDIRFYDVIYHALEEVKSAMVGMLEPVFKEKTLGRAEVREVFHISKVGTVAGCYVVEGVIPRNAKARLLRESVVVYNGKIESLKRFKEDVKEVQAGYECGVGLEKFNDIKVGDVIEAFELEEVTPELGKSMEEKDKKVQEQA